MKTKFLNTPLVKAYMKLVGLCAIPIISVSLYSAIHLGSANANIAKTIWWWFAAIVLLFIFTGAIVRRLIGNGTLDAANSLAAQAKTAASGDLRVTPEVHSANEYGEVQQGMDRMISGFRQTIAEIDAVARNLRSAAAEMAGTADEAGAAIGDVANAISAISEGATLQVDLVSRSADLVADIERSVQDASEHATAAKLQSEESERLAADGVRRAADVREVMQEMRERSLRTAAVVKSLGEKSSDIDVIVRAIADISQQTNMLALNASIEAARAGEQGRGFANVAGEVRVLAEDAQAAADEIAGVIMDIQTQTQHAVVAMEDGVNRVEQGFDTVNRNAQAFEDISQAVHALNENAGEISDLAAGIAGGTSRVRGQIGEVASVAQQSSASTEEVSASTQQSSASAQEVSASAMRLASTADALAALTAQFTLPEAA